MALYTGDLSQAIAWISQALESYRNLGIANRVAFILVFKCLPVLAEGRYEEAAGLTEEAQDILGQTGEREDAINVAIRARLARLNGDTTTARKIAEEMVNSGDASTFDKVLGMVELGQLELQRGDLNQAAVFFRQELHIYLSAPIMVATDDLFDSLALLAARQKKVEPAARLFGSRWCRGHAHLLSPIEKAWRETDWAAMRDDLCEEQFARLYEEGRRMSLDQAVKLAQEVCGA